MRVVRGRAFMVAVDIRPGSPTLGQVVTVEGSEDEPVLFWAPASFARGFCALADVTEIEYFCTADVQPALRVRHPLGRPGAGDRVAGGRAVSCRPRTRPRARSRTGWRGRRRRRSGTAPPTDLRPRVPSEAAPAAPCTLRPL